MLTQGSSNFVSASAMLVKVQLLVLYVIFIVRLGLAKTVAKERF